MGNFTVISEVHAGRDTIVYRGVRGADQAKVALKIPRSQHPTEREIEKLRYELLILRDLDLPGVVKAYGLEKHDGVLGLIMEDLGGETLAEAMRARRFDLRTALEIAAALAETLEAIHRRRVIHKDINPRNIIIDRATGEVKLIDFGLASRLSSEVGAAIRASVPLGTLAYMPPEQTGRMNRSLDHRADLYALGVTLYEILTGQLPFPEEDPLELVHSHLARVPAPPREIAPEIPAVVSDLVMKLLGKAAEDRYQTARGLGIDLRECLVRLARDGAIAPFPLARRDHSGDLRFPQRLYGREAELSALLAAFERARGGRAELCLVKGPAGVGKSTLVHEIQRPIAQRAGAFIAGKFDQLNRGVPYAPLAGALRDLFRDLLAGEKDELDRARAALGAALSPNAQILVELIPELGLILGPQPEVPTLGPVETQNRFAAVFQAMIRVFATEDRPFAIFLDDLQWADPASLALIQILLSDPETRHLLVIGAHRDGEVDAGHPLVFAAAAIRKAGARVGEIPLAPLDQGTVAEILADTLGADAATVAPLAALIFDRTHGNPFFMGQLVATLHREGRIRRDEASAAWTWDIEDLRAAGLAADVVTFMAARISALSPAARRALELAACIGHTFDLRTLAIIGETSEQRTAAALWEALREGLIAPLDPEYRFVHPPDAQDPEGAPGAGVFEVSYRFAHDRVQQAAYAQIEDAHRRDLHLRVGRLLLAARGPEDRCEDVFTLVRHLNIGADLITARSEQIDLARLDLIAGRRAKAATAYEAAAGYLGTAARLLGAAAWDEEYDLAFAVVTELAACSFLSRRYDEADRLFDEAIGRARTGIEKARICSARSGLFCAVSRYGEALACTRVGLGFVGVDLPEGQAAMGAAIAEALGEVQIHLRGRRVGDLVDAPPLTDPVQRAVFELLADAMGSAFVLDPTLLAYLSIRQVIINLQHGHTKASPFGYINYAFTLSVMGEYATAHAFGRLALDLCERLHSVEHVCKTHVMFALHTNFCVRHLRTSLPHLQKGLSSAPESGNFSYMSYAAMNIADIRLGAGDPLADVGEETEKMLALARRLGAPVIERNLTSTHRVVASLTGRTRAITSFSDDAFDEDAFSAELAADPNLLTSLAGYHAAKVFLLFLGEDLEAALAMGKAAEESAPAAAGLYFTFDLCFHLCLVLLSLPEAEGAEREARAAMLAKNRAKLEAWAASCPENFRHKKLLVDAEIARRAGDALRAMDLHDAAIKQARASGFTQDEAIAAELAARHYRAIGREAIAKIYLADAAAAYEAWGASAKVARIRQRFGAEIGRPKADPGSLPLDVLSVIKASQAISGEIDLDRLVTRLMTIALESAGAERGTLIRAAGEDLRVEAWASVEGQAIKVERPAPFASPPPLPASILNYVQRTHESVVLHDAAAEPRFSGDAYVAAAQPKSVLCVALLLRSALVGLLYLENNLASGAFTPDRLSLLQVLSSQAAISLENASLYAALSRENEERRRAEQEVRTLNAELERRVEDRTAQLEEANRELEAFSYSVSHDLRSPLRAIEGFSQAVVEDHGPELPAGAMDSLARVRKASTRMSQLIEDLLTLSRVTRAAISPGPVDLSAMAREIAADLRRTAPDRAVTIDVADGLAARGDERLVRIALENLIGNAFKFTEKHASARIEVGSLDRGDGRITYFVRDDGAGFDMKYAGKLFGTFQRLHANAEFAGTGVGLSTVRRIINRHGGRIWAEGAVEQGATFYFTL